MCSLSMDVEQGGIQEFWNKGVGVRFADFISFFLNIP